jgi:hypothetical protein
MSRFRNLRTSQIPAIYVADEEPFPEVNEFIKICQSRYAEWFQNLYSANLLDTRLLKFKNILRVSEKPFQNIWTCLPQKTFVFLSVLDALILIAVIGFMTLNYIFGTNSI